MQDVEALAKDALRHRLVLSYQALAEQVDADVILDAVLDEGGGAGARARQEGDRGLTVAPEATAQQRTPDRPGPGPLPETLLRALDLTIGRRIEGLLSGDHRSSILGAGSELAQVRPYVAGDDVRRIEWNVTARTGETHVRVDLAERVLVTWLALDVSASMSFGTAERRKADVAEGVALALGHLASRRGNRLGLVSFGDGNAQAIPPRQGRAGMLGLLLSLRREPVLEGGGATSLGAALGLVSRLARQRSLVAVVSDFRGPRDWRTPLLQLAGGHDVLAVEIRDPREETLPNVGELRLVDPETGRQLRVDTASTRLRERFAAAAAAERAEVARELTSLGVGARRPLDRGGLAAAAREPPEPQREDADELRLAADAARACWPSRWPSPATSCSSAGASEQAAIFASPALVPNLVGRRPGRLRHLPPALALLALAALATGLARPHATLSVDQEQATVVLAMDTSRSMVAKDVPPSRLAVAKQVVGRFLENLPEDYRVGHGLVRAEREHGAAGDREPRRGADRAAQPPHRRRHRARRGDRARPSGRAARAGGEGRRSRRPRSSSSRTGRRRRACSSRCRRRCARRN